MDDRYPYWLSKDNQVVESQKHDEKEISIQRFPQEDLDPFQIFMMKMDYLNSK